MDKIEKEAQSRLKWVNHRLLTTVLIYAGTDSFIYAACGFAGSTLPDYLEGKPPKESKAYWKWRSRHRRTTHWTVPYLTIILALMVLHQQSVLNGLIWEGAKLLIFVCAGALLHIFEDAVCGKVPLISHTNKIGIKLFKVGSAWEYLFTYMMCLAALYYKFSP